MSRQSDPSLIQGLGALASAYAALFRAMGRRLQERSDPRSVDVWMNPDLTDHRGPDEKAPREESR